MNMVRKALSTWFKALLTGLAFCLCLAQVSSAANYTGVRISGPADQDGGVVNYAVASTGQYAVYKTYKPCEPNCGGDTSLFSVSLSGGAPVRLTPTLPKMDEDSVAFLISPDGNQVAYRAYQGGISSLYTIPIAGGIPATRVSKEGDDVSQFNSFQYTPDGQWIIFDAFGGDLKTHLYRVPASGSDADTVAITIQGATNPLIENFKISPDSQNIVFLGRINSSADWGIYRMPLLGDGSQVVKLSKDFLHEYNTIYQITSGGQNVVYLYSFDDAAGDKNSLYSVPVEGPADENQNISGSLIDGREVYNFQLSPDGQHIVFAASGDVVDKYNLYSAPVRQTGQPASPIQLNPTGMPDREGEIFTQYPYWISPDSSWVAYQSNSNDQYNVVPLSGPASASVQINQPIDQPASITNFLLFTPDSQTLVFTSMQDTLNYVELYSIPVGSPASAAVKLNLPLNMGGSMFSNVSNLLTSADSQWVYYVARTTSSNIYNLFRVPVEGPAGTNQNLSGITADGNYARSPAQVPGSQNIVYIQQSPWPDQVHELYLTVLPTGTTTYTFLPMVVH